MFFCLCGCAPPVTLHATSLHIHNGNGSHATEVVLLLSWRVHLGKTKTIIFHDNNSPLTIHRSILHLPCVVTGTTHHFDLNLHPPWLLFWDYSPLVISIIVWKEYQNTLIKYLLRLTGNNQITFIFIKVLIT